MELLSNILGKEALNIGSRPMPTPRALLVRAISALDRSYTRYELPLRPSVAHRHLLYADLYVKFRTADTHLKY